MGEVLDSAESPKNRRHMDYPTVEGEVNLPGPALNSFQHVVV
jgi:hypothetical protein